MTSLAFTPACAVSALAFRRALCLQFSLGVAVLQHDLAHDAVCLAAGLSHPSLPCVNARCRCATRGAEQQ